MKRKTLLVVVAILAVVTLACGGIGGAEAPGAAQPSAESGGEQPPPADEPGDEQPAPPDEPAGAPEIAGLDTLSSYRLNIRWSGESEDGSQSFEMRILEEWVKEPPARHLVMSMSESGAEPTPFLESITIGDTTWMKMGEMWMQTEAPDQSSIGEGFTDTWGGLLTDNTEGLVLAGEETVNGVHCKHYTVGSENTITVPDPQSGGTVTVKVQGEAWVADQPGLPSVTVRERTQIEGGFLPLFASGTGAEAAIVHWEYDLTDINVPIAIEAPE